MSLTNSYNLTYEQPTSSGAGGAALDRNFAEINNRGGPCNWVATTDPTITSDSAHNFLRGSKWFNSTTDTLWVCVVATPGAAVWLPLLAKSGGTLTGPLYPAVSSIEAYGDSFTYGSEASNIATTAYIPLMSDSLGLSITNNGSGAGVQAADQILQIWSRVVSQSDLSIYMLGNNDQSHYGVNATKQSIFQSCHLSEIAFLAIPEVNKVLAYDTSKVTYSSGWSAPGTTDRIRMQGTTVGGTATFKVYGPAILVSMLAFDSWAGNYSIAVDGITLATSNVAGAATISTILNQTYCPRAHLFEGLTDGYHTVVITVNSGSIFFDWAAGIGSSYGPIVLVGNLLHMTSAGYTTFGGTDANLDSYNATIASNVYKLRSYGLDVRLVDVASQVNITTHLYSDGHHPIDSGHLVIAKTFLYNLTSPSSRGAPGQSGNVLINNSGVVSVPENPVNIDPISGDVTAPANISGATAIIGSGASHIQVFDTIVAAGPSGGRSITVLSGGKGGYFYTDGSGVYLWGYDYGTGSPLPLTLQENGGALLTPNSTLDDGFGNIMIGGKETITYSTADYTNTAGANSHVKLVNPSATGSSSITSIVNGTLLNKIRFDYLGDMVFVNDTTGTFYWFSGGDSGVGIQIASLDSSGVFAVGFGATYLQSWEHIFTATPEGTANGMSVRAGSISLYLYNDGWNPPALNAYDFWSSTPVPFTIASGGQTVTFGGGIAVTGNCKLANPSTNTDTHIVIEDGPDPSNCGYAFFGIDVDGYSSGYPGIVLSSGANGSGTLRDINIAIYPIGIGISISHIDLSTSFGGNVYLGREQTLFLDNGGANLVADGYGDVSVNGNWAFYGSVDIGSLDIVNITLPSTGQIVFLGPTGQIIFPDSSVQTTAYIGPSDIAQVLSAGNDAGGQSVVDLISISFDSVASIASDGSGDLTVSGNSFYLASGVVFTVYQTFEAYNGQIAFFNGMLAYQYTATGNTSIVNGGGMYSQLYADTTFDGGVGGNSYTLGDVIAAMKQYNLLPH